MWTVSKLNQHAIALLQAGYLEDGIQTEKRAVCLLKNLGSPTDESPKMPSNQQQRQDQTPPNGRFNRSLSPHHVADPFFGVTRLFAQAPSVPPQAQQNQQHRDFHHEQECDLPSHTNMFNVYTRAFVFNEEFSSHHKADTAAMLLFNLGLANHLYGLQDSNNSKQLRAALHLYKLSITALNQHGDVCSPLLGMALLTNMGNIQAHFSQHAEARQCLEGLEQCLSDPAHVNNLEEDELRFFFFHVTCNRVCQPLGAPAA